MGERRSGHQRQCRRGARGDQNDILAHGAESLPGTGFAALQQTGACPRDPEIALSLWLTRRELRSNAVRFMSYVLYKT
jgi:hypothetical protein